MRVRDWGRQFVQVRGTQLGPETIQVPCAVSTRYPSRFAQHEAFLIRPAMQRIDATRMGTSGCEGHPAEWSPSRALRYHPTASRLFVAPPFASPFVHLAWRDTTPGVYGDARFRTVLALHRIRKLATPVWRHRRLRLVWKSVPPEAPAHYGANSGAT